jgi:hypothetical protein
MACWPVWSPRQRLAAHWSVSCGQPSTQQESEQNADEQRDDADNDEKLDERKRGAITRVRHALTLMQRT